MAYSASDQAKPWQHASFAETNLHMFEHEVMCDVIFLVGKNEEPVLANRFMLASRSPVFCTMFRGPFTESKDNTIRVPDIETSILRTVIQYMYTAECQLTGDTVMELLYAAKKYELHALAIDCLDFLNTNMGDENICTILQQAIMFCEEGLVKQCFCYIFNNGPSVFKSRSFLSLDREVVQRIIESDELDVDELSIYRACRDWAKYQCTESGEDTSDANLRHKLNDLIYYIRFPNMTVHNFTTHVSHTGILTDTEKVNIFQRYFEKGETDGKFMKKKQYTKVDSVIARFNEIKSGWWHGQTISVVSFTSSKTVQLKGVFVFSPSTPAGIKGNLEISDADRTLCVKDFIIQYLSGKQFEEILLKSPLTIVKGKVYNLRQKCDGTTYYGLNGKGEVVANGVKITFLKNSPNKSGTVDDKEGQFYGIHLL